MVFLKSEVCVLEVRPSDFLLQNLCCQLASFTQYRLVSLQKATDNELMMYKFLQSENNS